MSGVSLVLYGLLRSKLQFALLIFAITVAFVVYGVVASFGEAVNAPVSLAGGDRLVVTNRMSITQPLPYALCRSRVPRRRRRSCGAGHVVRRVLSRSQR